MLINNSNFVSFPFWLVVIMVSTHLCWLYKLEWCCTLFICFLLLIDNYNIVSFPFDSLSLQSQLICICYIKVWIVFVLCLFAFLGRRSWFRKLYSFILSWSWEAFMRYLQTSLCWNCILLKQFELFESYCMICLMVILFEGENYFKAITFFFFWFTLISPWLGSRTQYKIVKYFMLSRKF